ncbi:galactose-1-phosphate uridylyltransferase [Erythrobacter sp. YT30]|uniref:galactose-1-phosphate uridylyltransferase n=1 Tax=Erythrobacter sp. YT30 TaxID=1735012 RepID=UPI00076C8FB1|nr:galactose-1-phosphate uridylyltransferase [Erythrobacter sp. YT30]KWV91905.1 galactose-1-phosphate uridylyltransferase [Erythrobacter sp. YT30]
MSGNVQLSRSVGEGATYRRDHQKADGRMLHLYGRNPHTLPVQHETADPVAQGGEIRHHPLRQEWNVYAAHRQNRTFKPSAADDPLAPTVDGGPETEIPFSDFEVAIFENKFAAFHPSASNAASLARISIEPAKGACDVVVYAPDATGSLHTLGRDRREVQLGALIDRYETHFAAGCDYVLPFENRGDEVGVTLHHPHGQIYGFDRVPHTQQRAIDAFAQGYDLAAEIRAAMPEYGLGEEGGMAAFVPRFARFPYETWIAPFETREGPWDCSDEELEALAFWLGETTRRYDALFEQPAATMMAFHASPRGGSKGYHFTVQFYPLLRAPGRVKYLASVEQHTGIFTVDVMPEMAIADLRALAQS